MTQKNDIKDEEDEVASNAIEEEGSDATSNVADGEIEVLQEQLEEAENKYRRALADYHNLQKRVNDEKGDWIRTANGNLILRLLPALDHLETALRGAKESGQESGWLKGVEMTVLELKRVLEEEGLKPVQTEKFDANVHEVVEARVGPEGSIEDVFQMGYTLNDKLIRPAKVAVGKGE